MNIASNISIIGLWHLGCITAACCSKYYNIVAYDNSDKVVQDLNKGISPIYEPFLEELIQKQVSLNKLKFTSNIDDACAHSDIFWITYDTPVNENDEGDLNIINDKVMEICTKKTSATIIISSQVPVTTCSKFKKLYPQHKFVYIPENLRLGQGISTFEKADRFIVGCNESDKQFMSDLLSIFNVPLIFMGIESAEMVKHSINCYLALSITFINEIAKLCECVNANANEVSIGLKSDSRIGKKAYLSPGGPFAGGTLARDIVTLNVVKDVYNKTTPIISSILESNKLHQNWYIDRCLSKFESIEGKNVLLMGLSYTDNTDTLRRSMAMTVLSQLRTINNSGKFYAYDSFIKTLPAEYNFVELVESLDNLKVDIVMVFTPQEKMKSLNWKGLRCTDTLFLDANKFLYNLVCDIGSIEYKSVGNV